MRKIEIARKISPEIVFRSAWLEIESGLYQIITRGNDRRPIFHSAQDHAKFLSLMAAQQRRLPFFLYAYCLMTNHVHLLNRAKGAHGRGGSCNYDGSRS